MRSAPLLLLSAMVAALLFAGPAVAGSKAGDADAFAALCKDRTALERVYHEHRTGTKKSFEETMPPELVEKLVRQDLKKEAVLKNHYGVEITSEMEVAEVQRMDATSRAPEVLAELKAALGNDPERIGHSLARPILVEGVLQSRFENDDALHTPRRQACEAVGKQALAEEPPEGRVAVLKAAGSKDGAVFQDTVTWILTPRPTGNAPAPENVATPGPTEAKATGGLYSNEATAQVAQVLTSPGEKEGEEPHYLEDLATELRNMLLAQLRSQGDVSAVIESPVGFMIFVARQRNEKSLSVAALNIPKLGLDEWLASQPDVKPNDP